MLSCYCLVNPPVDVSWSSDCPVFSSSALADLDVVTRVGVVSVNPMFSVSTWWPSTAASARRFSMYCCSAVLEVWHIRMCALLLDASSWLYT